jgi:hypothetical protein
MFDQFLCEFQRRECDLFHSFDIVVRYEAVTTWEHFLIIYIVEYNDGYFLWASSLHFIVDLGFESVF